MALDMIRSDCRFRSGVSESTTPDRLDPGVIVGSKSQLDYEGAIRER
jgi:hypothetical protein